MTYDFTLERVIDATPDEGALLDPEGQDSPAYESVSRVTSDI